MYAEVMDDPKEMLRAIINGQSAMKSELLGEIQKVEKKLSTEIGNLKTDLGSLRRETKEGFEKLTRRIDKIGLQVARLEDDTPTRDEFDNVDSRLKKLEQN
jgi:hypothetical protein